MLDQPLASFLVWIIGEAVAEVKQMARVTLYEERLLD